MLNGLSKFYNEFIAEPIKMDKIEDVGDASVVKVRGAFNKKRPRIQETTAEFNPEFGIEFKKS